MTRLRSLQEHLNRWMLAYVSLAMAGGLAIGYPAASTAKSAAAAIGGLTSVAVFFIVYPMMVNVRFEALAPNVPAPRARDPRRCGTTCSSSGE